MDNDELKTFYSQYPEQRLRKGDALIQGHEDPPGVIQLAEGSVIQYDISSTGQRVVVNIFKPGAFFPMSWAINKTPNAYIFEAAENIRYRVAPPDKIIAFLLEHPAILLDLMGRVYRGTVGLQRRMTLLMSGDARKRLLFEIYVMCQRFGTERPDGTWTVGIIEEDLATYTGLARETVSRQIQKLKDEGIIKGTRGKIVIPSMTALTQRIGLL
jgi:cAMP-binding proteins - catabolite gene activator and regulatory subunit of cAMP-dependent protein kinases